ncbi:MAG TPA: hypothetical protein VHS78_00285 [Candidatus Elarobacter sp.]|nr:hypothetical protein [Candidatus Elarobacter sp.]
MSFLARLFRRRPSREAFAAEALAAARRAGFEAPAYDPDGFAVVSGSQRLGLENLYRSYCALPPAERAAFLAESFRSLLGEPPPETFDAVREMLVPMIRARAEQMLMKSAPEPVALVERPFSEDLVVTLVIDRPTMVARVRRTDLERWNVDEETAFAAALHNLRLRSSDSWVTMARGVYCAAWNDAFDVTRIVFPDLVRRLPLEGEPVVMTPNRDYLLAASAREPDQLQTMAQLAARSYDENPYPLSMQPLVLRGDRWEPFELGGAASREIRGRLVERRAEDYEMQANAYGDRFGASFAKLMLDGRPGAGELRTLATWQPGSTALVPAADVLGVLHERGALYVPRDDALRILSVGPESELWPPRYRLTGVPTEEQMAALHAASDAAAS